MGKNMYVTPDRYQGEISEIDPVDTPHFFSTHYHSCLSNHFHFLEDVHNIVSADLQITMHGLSPVTISYESDGLSQERDGMQQLREKYLILDLLNAVYRTTNYQTHGTDEEAFQLPGSNTSQDKKIDDRLLYVTKSE